MAACRRSAVKRMASAQKTDRTGDMAPRPTCVRDNKPLCLTGGDLAIKHRRALDRGRDGRRHREDHRYDRRRYDKP
jgi:hypothetical protein